MSEDAQELVNRYSKKIKGKIEKIDNLERFLKEGLGGAFLKMKGGFEQYRDGEIDIDGLILSGIYVLKFQFINIFLIDKKTREAAKKMAAGPKPEPVVAKFTIPNLFLDSDDNITKKKPKIEAPADNITKKKPKVEAPAEPGIIQKPIAYVKPAYVSRTTRDAQKTVDIALDKINLNPIHYDKIDDRELKSVNVGAIVPGGPLVNEFNEVRELIYKKEYDQATKLLEEIREMAEAQDNDHGFDMAVDMLANLSAYKMIPVMIEAGDKVMDEPGKAGPKYKKALGFAKLVKDSHYISKIEKRMTQVNERLNFTLRKKEFEDKEEDKTKGLIMYNLSVLSKKESLMGIEEIRKYCNAKTDELIIEVLVEMIQNGQIYAKFFPDSKRVMFDREANKDSLTFRNI